jgi:hypothetical protein
MPFDSETIGLVFEKSDGKCHHCGKQLAWANYGRRDARGGWEIDHSLPRARGGTDHLNNLVASCWTCNLDKSDMSYHQFRRQIESPVVRSRSKDVDSMLGEIIELAVWAGLVYVGVRILSSILAPRNSHRPPQMNP